MILGLMEPSGLIEQGGPLVWVLLGLAFIGAVCVVERLFFFHRARINVGDLLVGLSHHIRRRAFAEALHEAARAPGPVARVAHAALLRYYLPRADLRDVAQEAGQLEVPLIEKNIRVILGVSLLAPLVNFFIITNLACLLARFLTVSMLGVLRIARSRPILMRFFIFFIRIDALILCECESASSVCSTDSLSINCFNDLVILLPVSILPTLEDIRREIIV